MEWSRICHHPLPAQLVQHLPDRLHPPHPEQQNPLTLRTRRFWKIRGSEILPLLVCILYFYWLVTFEIMRILPARFRIKKKQKTLELERTVSDLTSRATELEREAANLRRENTWLKEIVIMKGRQNISNNQGESSGRNESKSSRRGKEETSEESSDANSSDGEKASKKSKGKGKAKK